MTVDLAENRKIWSLPANVRSRRVSLGYYRCVATRTVCLKFLVLLVVQPIAIASLIGLDIDWILRFVLRAALCEACPFHIQVWYIVESYHAPAMYSVSLRTFVKDLA